MNTFDDIRWMSVLRAVAIFAVFGVICYEWNRHHSADSDLYGCIRSVIAILSAWFVLEGLHQNAVARNASTQLDYLKLQLDLRKRWQDWRSELDNCGAADGRSSGYSDKARAKALEYWSRIVLDEYRALQDLRPAAMPGVWDEHKKDLRDAMGDNGILSQEYLTYADSQASRPAYEQRYRRMLADLWEATRKGHSDLHEDDELRRLRLEDVNRYKTGIQ